MRRKAFVLLPISLIFLLVFIETGGVRADEGYAGSETCKGCHEDAFKSYSKSPHGKKAISWGPAAKDGCESCHGPGAEHAGKGGGKGVAIFAFGRDVDSRTRASKCLSCHEESKTLASWDIGRHKSAGVSCDNCHSIHGGTGRSSRPKEPDLCYSCHKYIRTQQNKQSHHPVKEGRITCSHCHDPHGTFGPRMVKADSVNDLCYKCHAEKRGPYAFEHPPVHENCLTCHEIHGSNHTKLLVRKVPFLCQSCHSTEGHPSRPYTNLHAFGGSATAQKNKFFGRSCLNCHGNIHGSSRSQGFIR
ncbi:MAG: DmsE family decaheme c-type cytochrome [Thermodesulfobacteriota bacterium]